MGRDQGAAEPRLARHRIVREMNDARLVDDLAFGGELARVDDDLRPALVTFEAELEHEDGGWRRELHAHRLEDLEVVRPGEVLAREKTLAHPAQPLGIAAWDAAHEKPRRRGFAPQRRVDRNGGVGAAKPAEHQEGASPSRFTDPEPAMRLSTVGSP